MKKKILKEGEEKLWGRETWEKRRADKPRLLPEEWPSFLGVFRWFLSSLALFRREKQVGAVFLVFVGGWLGCVEGCEVIRGECGGRVMRVKAKIIGLGGPWG